MMLANHKTFLNEIGHVVVYLNKMIKIYSRPYYVNVIASITLFVVIIFLYFRKKSLASFTKNLIAMLAILYCSYLVSAPVWNHMKKPWLFQRTSNGPNYVEGRLKAQYLVESYIVAIANAAIALGMILVIEGEGGVRGVEQRPRVGKRWLRRLQSCIGLTLICVFFSLLLSMLKTKRRHYPYNFLFE